VKNVDPGSESSKRTPNCYGTIKTAMVLTAMVARQGARIPVFPPKAAQALLALVVLSWVFGRQLQANRKSLPAEHAAPAIPGEEAGPVIALARDFANTS